MIMRLLRATAKTFAAVTLALVLALSGALSALPLAGEVFRPLTVHAATNLSGTYKLTAHGELTPTSGGTAITFSSTEAFTLTADTVIDLNGNTLQCASIRGKAYNLTIHGDGAGGVYEIGSGTLSGPAIEAKTVTLRNFRGIRCDAISGDSYGIYAENEVVIQNTPDAFNVQSSDGTTNKAPAIYSEYGNVSISAGRMLAEGTSGIYAKNGTVIIENNSSVNTGGYGGNPSYGIFAGGDVTVSNSSVTAKADGSGTPAQAIYGKTGIVFTSSEVFADTASGVQEAIGSGGTIALKGSTTKVVANNADSSQTYSAVQADGQITYDRPLEVSTPSNGYVTDKTPSGQHIVDSTGKAANSVQISLKEYTVTVHSNPSTGGSGYGVPSVAHSGDTVYLTAVPSTDPAAPYKFKEWKIVSGITSLPNPTKANTSFTMPASDVEVTATFEPLQRNEVAICVIVQNGNGTANANVASLNLDTITGKDPNTCTLTAVPDQGWMFDKWEIHTGANTTFNLNITLGSPNSATTTLTVGSGSANLTNGGTIYVDAHFKLDPGGGGTTPTPTPTPSGGGSSTDTGTYNIWYEFTSGHGQTWMKGSAEPALFTAVRSAEDNTTFSRFTGVTIDGVTLDKAYYTAVEGSVKLSVSADYLNTLSEGQHTIRALFADGHAEGKFTILSQTAPATMTRVNAPQTSDANARTASVAGGMLLLSLAGLFAITWKSMRRNSKI